MQIEHVPIDKLQPYPNNARTHSKKQIRQIAKSLERFGFCNPVLIDENYQIIAGHGRVAAAKLLNMKELPTVQISHLGEADKRAYILADNKLALNAGWDREILAIELQGLAELNYEVEITGFETPEIDIILDESRERSAKADEPEDEIPAYSGAHGVARPDDLWMLGEHLLLCADARRRETFDRLLDGKQAAQVFSDPPYNVPIDGHVCGLGRIRHRDFAMGCGEMTEHQFTAFLATVFHLLVDNTVNGSIHHLCMDWRHCAEMISAGRQAYTELKNICVWNKSNAGMGSFYRSKHELVFVWKNGDAPHVNNFELGQHGRNRTNVWDYAGINSGGAGRLEDLAMHPTVKPVALVVDALKDCSRHGDLVLDPFAGSGTILIAAERTGRRARAIELDPAYVDVAIRRWHAYTGKMALLLPVNEPFEAIAEQRAVSRAIS